MFGQHGGDMGMVMLDGDGRQAEAFGVARGQEIRVQVVGDGDRLDLQDVQQMLDRLFEEAERRRVVQVAQMLGQVGLCATGHADGVLQVAAYREDGRNGVRQGHAARDISSGAADEGRSSGDHAGDAVVAADQDVAVVGDDAVGDAGKPFSPLPGWRSPGVRRADWRWS